MITKEQLLKYVTISPLQGYALYYEEDGQVLECYNGFRKVGEPAAIDADSNFRLASVTKQFIGHGVRALIENGKLSYETTLDQLYDNLPEYLQKLSIEQLLNHVTGIRDYDGSENKLHMDRQLVDADVLEFLCSEKDGYFTPGTQYKYSNSAYVLLGLIIEKISGTCIEDYMRETVFRPFGMEHTEINRQGVSDIKNRVYGTKLEEDHLVLHDQGHTSATIGDGAVYSNVNDLKIYLNKLETMNLEKIYDRRSKADDGILYSKGIRISKYDGFTMWHHTGGTCGTHNFVGIIPEKNIKVIFLSNIDAIDASLMRKSIEEYLGVR
ncbi:MAG: beta-lactamase family protein [Clostridia bacterium]|nr:beta-lactamase family protein [Clostridia bacterium]